MQTYDISQQQTSVQKYGVASFKDKYKFQVPYQLIKEMNIMISLVFFQL